MAKKLQQEQPQQQQQNSAPVRVLSFDQWWVTVSAKHAFRKPLDLKKVLEKHFKATGIWQSKDWDLGVKHFGWKV